MSPEFKQHITPHGETILYVGNPELSMLDTLAGGPGDIWHSSFDQGYKNLFQDLVYQTAIFFIYINDFDQDKCISWRLNPAQFAVRKNVWEVLGGFENDYDSDDTRALHFAYNALRFRGATPLYIKGLFTGEMKNPVISDRDRYVFYRKNFKPEHSIFMLYRKGFLNLKEWKWFLYAKKNFKRDAEKPVLPPRKLGAITGNPTVSYIIPTMYRQDYTLRLLDDLSTQGYLPGQVVVVDATPEHARDGQAYYRIKYPFDVTVIWQTSKGSCRARNEAIEKCTGDYIVFGDDDIRMPPDFIENQIRMLQTYNAEACNGLDIRADHHEQDLDDLRRKLDQIGEARWVAGPAQGFNNANSCVRRDYVEKIGGNDINFDGGYGEDRDFGISLLMEGAVVLHNPFSANLHLKPPAGGFRFWGAQSRIIGKKRKTQPWELDTPVKWVRPVPSPTIMYQIVKHYTPQQLIEYKHKYFFLFLFKGSKSSFLYRLLRIPYKLIQFRKSVFYARKLNALGVRIR